MNKRHIYLLGGIFLAGFAYCLFYFNYLATPTEDFLGNIRGRVIEYMAGDFPGTNYKFLPVYPLLLAFLSKLNFVSSTDVIFSTALYLNIALFIPYIVVVYLIYKRFLSRTATAAALLFICANIYTVLTAINSELEMLLALLIVCTVYLAMIDSRLSYVTAFFAAGTKWDSVFAIPAAMFRDFFYRKKRLLAIILGVAATSGIAVWFVLSTINTSQYANPYVGEIARRGPNVYRYLIDCILVLSGFIQWMAIDGYFSKELLVKAPAFAFVMVAGVLIIIGVVWGFVLLIKKQGREAVPMLIFFAGFLLVHMVYQNTKDRYVLPVLWLLTLALFYGFSEGIFPWLADMYRRYIRRRRWRAPVFYGIVAMAYAVSIGLLLHHRMFAHIAFALVFTLLLYLILRADGEKIKGRIAVLVLTVVGGVLFNFMVFYGHTMMDHHSLRRVEFKKAALWYKDAYKAGDRMLITEISVPMYYTGFGADRFVSPNAIESATLKELQKELAEKGVTYVFVDDFYIRRYEYKDKNAIDKKAWLFKEIRDGNLLDGRLTLVAFFETGGGIKSYVYRFVR